MISLTAILITTVLAAVLYWLVTKDSSKKNYPPGPWGLPLLGNILQLGIPYIKFQEWSKKFGKIFMFRMGTSRVVVLSDYQLLREAYNEPNLSGKIDQEIFTLLTDGKFGILNNDGHNWSDQRRFTIRNLRDMGFGRKTMESLIEVEVREYLEFLKKNENSPVSIQRQLSLAVLNSLWVILTGKRYAHDDPFLVEMFTRSNQLAEDFASSPALFFPSVAKLFPNFSGWAKVMELVHKFQSFALDTIKYHQDTYPADEVPRDFVDAYLKEVKSTTDNHSSFYGKTGEKNLMALMTDFLVAGSDSTSFTLAWAVLYLCKFPEAQKKFHEELDRVVGRNRSPCLADRPDLPYTEAVILETLRLSSIVPIGIFHRCMTDIKFHGFDIRKDDWICGDFYNIHNSKELWKSPEVFEPSRFLTDDGKSTKRPDTLMPFSYGKRACIGESLARDSLFLFLTSVFHKYEIKLAPESENIGLDAKPGFILSPKEFKVVIEERL